MAICLNLSRRLEFLFLDKLEHRSYSWVVVFAFANDMNIHLNCIFDKSHRINWNSMSTFN